MKITQKHIDQLKWNLAKFDNLPDELKNAAKEIGGENFELLNDDGEWISAASNSLFSSIDVYRLKPYYELPIPERKFKEGDNVRIIGNSCNHRFEIGTTVILESYNSTWTCSGFDINGDYNRSFVSESDMELVSESLTDKEKLQKIISQDGSCRGISCWDCPVYDECVGDMSGSCAYVLKAAKRKLKSIEKHEKEESKYDTRKHMELIVKHGGCYAGIWFNETQATLCRLCPARCETLRGVIQSATQWLKDNPKEPEYEIYEIYESKDEYGSPVYCFDMGAEEDYILTNCLSMVGFAGVQFEGQENTENWYMITSAFIDEACLITIDLHGLGEIKPAIPKRVRFLNQS